MMIESLKNEKIKYINRILSDNRFRKKEKIFVVEGKQENKRAIQYGFEAQEFFICENIFKETLPDGIVHLISEKIYENLAYRGSSEGILGVYKVKENSLKNFSSKNNSSIIVVEGVEKPGNLGAIIRSCEAFGIDAIIVTDEKTDFYNPNVIRSSVGCLFGINFFSCSNEEALSFFEKENVKVYSTYMSDKAKDIHRTDLSGKVAIIFGTEHSGISTFWQSHSKNILIPMVGTIDSLNLSNAVAISCYEILRQKN